MPTGKRTSIEDIKNKLISMYEDLVIIDESTYINTATKCLFIHKIYGLWEALPCSVLRGHIHPKSSSERHKIKKEEIRERIFKIHGDSVVLDESTYTNMNVKSTFIHKIYGPWETLLSDVLKGSTHREVSSKRRRLTKKEAERKLKRIHKGEVVIVWETYKNIDTPCKFIHVEHGEWTASPYSVFLGSSHPITHNSRIAKSSQNTYIRTHWKTRKKLICQASYEPKVVDYLNTNKINYLWQPQIFKTPFLTKKGKNRTYLPDLYLIDSNTWVEIKGWFRKDALDKWNWFKTEFPTAELWDKKKLKEMGIL